MIGKINKYGYLELKRGKEWEDQLCPYTEDAHCGDHCPLLNEPKNKIMSFSDSHQREYTELKICNGQQFNMELKIIE